MSSSASYQQQQWSATFILFIFWALVGLIAAPFTSQRYRATTAHPPPVTQLGQAEAGGTHTANNPVPLAQHHDPAMPHITEPTHRKLTNLTRATQTGFLLLFTTTVVHGAGPAPSYTTANSALTWISFAFLLIWYAVTAMGFGDSVVYELVLIIPVVVLQIINFGLGFSAT
ncbi:hypothetical protein BC830DRAFT_1135339 [Chytriomyces sp. MP71]|nr:hypothetical protein BC830DRAFT_1135339 [Chytriomyces sp. MP71]